MLPSGDLASAFAAQVQRDPQALAAIHYTQSLTYQDLNQRAEVLAQRLLQRGLDSGQLVGLSIAPSLDMLVAMLGILKAGGVVVPLDPQYPLERLHFLITDSQLKGIVSLTHASAHLQAQPAKLIYLDQIDTLSQSHVLPTIAPHHLAFCLYTSGSSGRPKGVLLEHQALTRHCLSMQSWYAYQPEDRGLLFASLNYVAALEQVFMPLLSGACLVIREQAVWTAAEFPQKIRDYGVTVADLPPNYLHSLLESWAAQTDLSADFPLRLLIVGGEELRPSTVRLWQRSGLNKLRLLNAYGMTETPVTALLFDVPLSGDFDRVPIGRAVQHWQVYLLNDALQQVALGEIGEICIGGAGLARAYLNQPALSAEKFISNPFASGRLYRTGDLGCQLADGTIQYLGRKDHQVQIRGFRLELGEIETLLHQHPQLETAALVAVGEGSDKRLIAYCVPNASQAMPPAQFKQALRDYLQARLPAQMLPDSWVLLQSMLLTPNGKVNRPALAALGRGKPDGSFRVQLSEYGSPDKLALMPSAAIPPQADEVQLDTRAASLNFRDALNAYGMLQDYNREHLGIDNAAEVAFGYECAGVVTAVGDAVSEIKVGDAVLAYTLGSLASVVTVNARQVALKPEALSFAEAATIPTVFLSVYYGLKELANISAKDTVLIHSAAGGVGLAAVQLAQAVGANIIATASPSKWDFLKAQGIKTIFNSRTLDFARQMTAAGMQADIVINSLSNDFIDKSFAVLATHGRFIELGKINIWTHEKVAQQRPDVAYYPFDLGDIIAQSPALVARLMDDVLADFAAGRLTPLPLKTFPITQVAEAFRYLSQARHIGKVVLSFEDSVESAAEIIEDAADAPTCMPQTATEHRLHELWCKILGCKRCDTRHSFFALGGNSLLALELSGRMNNAFGVNIPLQHLLEYNTIEQLGQQIDTRLSLQQNAASLFADEEEYEEGVL